MFFPPVECSFYNTVAVRGFRTGGFARMTWCEQGELLNIICARTAQEVGLYENSLKSVARTSEHRRERERLEAENNRARRAFQEHLVSCTTCSEKT